MNNAITIHVPAVPVAQPRARATSIGGKARMYEAKKEHPVYAYKATVRMACCQAYKGKPLTGPLSVEMTALFPRPGRLIWKKRPMPRERHVGAPDVDNLEKSAFDALNGLLWIDDGQICEATIRKFYASGDEQPHVEIVVREIGT